MRRRRLRLDGFDYSTPGAYFVTVCTHRREPLLASPAYADSVWRCWREIPRHFEVELDVLAILPDHIHGIVMLRVGAGHARPLQSIVGSFKSAAARDINLQRNTPGAPVWQRGYFDRVVRSDTELEALREYVSTNPEAWNVLDDMRPPARHEPAAEWLQG